MARGYPMSPTARAKLSARMKGHGWGGKRHVGGHKGHRMSAAQKAKISKALKGKKHPHKGHSPTAATRAKIGAALRKRDAARGTRRPRATTGTRHLSAKSLGNLRRPAKGAFHRYVMARGLRTHKFHSGTHRLISSTTYRSRKSLLHTKVRRRRTRIIIHRYVRHHRVWHRKKRKRR